MIWLDLHVTTWNGYVYLYRNNQDGTFTDVTASSGIDTSQYYHQMPIMADFNGDSRLDIYAAVDFGVGNFLWLNQGDGTFVDGAPARRRGEQPPQITSAVTPSRRLQ